MDKYKSLENLCNAMIEKGRVPFDLLPKEVGAIQCIGDGITIDLRTNGMTVDYSYHDLFSKDSVFLEAVEWEYIEDLGPLTIWQNHAMIMGPMSAEEKITYLLDNIIQ